MFLRFEVLALILFVVGLGLAYFVFKKVPQGFVPSEDQGYLIVAIQAPTGASLEYTRNIGRQVSAITKNIPEIQGTFSVAGFSFGGATPNAGLVFLPLRAYGKREGEEHSAAAVINRLRGPLFGISGAIVIPFEPPAVQGLGEFGGFQYELLDQGSHTLQDLDKTTHDLIRASSQRPEKDLTGLFTSYTSNDPQYVVTIDREKAKSLHIPLSQITDTLSVYMGSSYINDFDFNNRSYRVYSKPTSNSARTPRISASIMSAPIPGRWFLWRIGQHYAEQPRPRSSITTIFSARQKSTAPRRPASAPDKPSMPCSNFRQRFCPRDTPTNGREFPLKNWLRDRPRSSSSASERWSST